MKVEQVNLFLCQLCVLTFSVTQETPQFDALMAYLQRAQLEIRQIRCGERRHQELQRHIFSAHLPYWLHCPHFPCLWRGHHEEEFETHLRAHPDSDPEVAPCSIYERKINMDFIKDGTPVKTAAGYALDLVSEMARELGFVEEWCDLWG